MFHVSVIAYPSLIPILVQLISASRIRTGSFQLDVYVSKKKHGVSLINAHSNWLMYKQGKLKSDPVNVLYQFS